MSHPNTPASMLLRASLIATVAVAIGPAVAQSQEEPEGIPVTHQAVIANCSGCHVRDSTGRMSRISYMRKTPEGWQNSIRRMVMLSGVKVEPEVARDIVRYLSNEHGLAPEEARPGMFDVERRVIDWEYEGDEDTQDLCKRCHSMGRAILQRRTKDEWGLLIELHRGLYPVVEFQGFRRGGPADEDDDDPRHPMDKASAHLSKAFPLETDEWRAWHANKRPARLAGRWALVGTELGKGPVYGSISIDPAGDHAAEDFTTEIEYTYARTGETVQRSGRSTVYTGFQWRGRSFAGSDQESAWREVMFVERDWQEMSGRWFHGANDELGVDVTLRRVRNDPVILGVHPTAVQTGGVQAVTIYGANLPAGLNADAIDLGPGLVARNVTGRTATKVTVEVAVAPDAVLGGRDVFVGGANLENGLAVFDEIDRIAVEPRAGMARVGGIVFPKQYQPFQAVGYHNGPDGDPETDDDVRLDIVDVEWGLEEYTRTFDDNDIEYVGQIDQHGLFTPAVDGPNPQRPQSRNNVGDVWVVATYTGPHAAKEIRARAHLIVTVPLYMRWEPWKVTKP